MENTYRLKEKLEDLWREIGRAEELLADLESGRMPQKEVFNEDRNVVLPTESGGAGFTLARASDYVDASVQ